MRFIRLPYLLTLLAFVTLLLNGCGGKAWRYDPGIPGKVTNLRAESGNQLVTLSWTGDTTATRYRVYYVSALSSEELTRTNSVVVTCKQKSVVIGQLQNGVAYRFMVTALNKDGESEDSDRVACTPAAPVSTDLEGIWYFHTLVTGPDARWERGTLTVQADGSAAISDFEDSSGNTNSPTPVVLSVDAAGGVTQSGAGAWADFHGNLGSRKNLIVATWSAGLQSRALTIFQKRKDDAAPAYSIQDISGTGSGQNPYNPYIQGNGPTRFAYHQLYSGSKTQWEYANAKVGQHGNIWIDDYKDIIYWDFSTPISKTVNYDYLWKCTSVGVDADGRVTEYWNFPDVASAQIPSFNTLVPKQPHDVVFTGRMTGDKTVVIGVGTTTDYDGGNPRYFMRIVQLCFIPTDQALPTPGLDDLAGDYTFHRIASGAPGEAPAPSWAHGNMTVAQSGGTSFTSYLDSTGATAGGAFMLAYYPDPNPDLKLYTDFANFTTAPQDGGSHYYDVDGNPLATYYDFASFGSYVGIPSTWRTEDVSGRYYNEHASLSYNRDLLVMTGTDASGFGMLVGLK